LISTARDQSPGSVFSSLFFFSSCRSPTSHVPPIQVGIPRRGKTNF
jgi:hypothetical protein